MALAEEKHAEPHEWRSRIKSRFRVSYELAIHANWHCPIRS
jgi:hypothetical protein